MHLWHSSCWPGPFERLSHLKWWMVSLKWHWGWHDASWTHMFRYCILYTHIVSICIIWFTHISFASCALWYYLMIEIPSNNACCCSQEPACLCLQFVAPLKTKTCRWKWFSTTILWEPTEIDGMLPSLRRLLVECAGKREPLCEVAGMPKAKDPLELRKVQCGWCALSVSTWFDLTFASEHHAQQIDSMIPLWSTCDRNMAAHV